jgi:hypothetical protein
MSRQCQEVAAVEVEVAAVEVAVIKTPQIAIFIHINIFTLLHNDVAKIIEDILDL